MSLISNPSKCLEHFLGYSEARIQEDRARASANPKEVLNQLRGLPKSIPSAPDVDALWHHLSLVLAQWMWHSETGAPEIAAFHAISSAERIAEAAGSVAAEKGKLGEMVQRIDAIRAREGLADDEFWTVGHGPLDYQDQENQLERETEKIEDTVLIFVLNRYGLPELANLYDRDRTEFEIQREIGRRVFVDGDDSGSAINWDGLFAREHGIEALSKVRARVAEIRRLA